MASYTEYFYEYIENGNEILSVFDSISSFNGVSFADMFKKQIVQRQLEPVGQDSKVTFFALGWKS